MKKWRERGEAIERKCAEVNTGNGNSARKERNFPSEKVNQEMGAGEKERERMAT